MLQSELFPAPAIVVNGHTEEWRTVVGFLRYEVSTLGRFRRKSTQAQLKCKVVNSYHIIGLMRDGHQVWKLAHRLVAETFIGPQPPGKPVVNHLNHVKTDNRLANLEWSSYSHNSIHGHRR